MFDENVVSYFPARVYNGIEDLAETSMNPANCRSFIVAASATLNFNFAQPEPI